MFNTRTPGIFITLKRPMYIFGTSGESRYLSVAEDYF